jgi:hypothetical protein
MKVHYDPKGIGIAELMGLALYHPIMYALVTFLIAHNAGKIGLKIARLTIGG